MEKWIFDSVHAVHNQHPASEAAIMDSVVRRKTDHRENHEANHLARGTQSG